MIYIEYLKNPSLVTFTTSKRQVAVREAKQQIEGPEEVKHGSLCPIDSSFILAMIFVMRRRLEALMKTNSINFLGIQNDAKLCRPTAWLCWQSNAMGSLKSECQKEDATVEHVYCRGAVTELLKYGQRDLHTATKNSNSPQVLILIIPGNPGIVGFYKTFMWTLYQAFNQRYPVWAVSHAGHCAPPDTMDMVEDASVAESGDVFGLNGQIEHKLGFLLEHVPRDTRLILIGHSIGCYIILEMMKRDPELKVVKSVLLFPTIERMASTPQGKVMTPVLCHLRYVVYLPIFLLSLLPERLKAGMVQLVLRNLHSLDTSCVSATLSLINVDCAANAMYMGSQEMRMVLDRDNLTIHQHLDKLVFYYGATDHWCPVQYYQDIRRDFPEGDIRLCERGLRHAFVLDAGEEMANMITQWIRDDLRGL